MPSYLIHCIPISLRKIALLGVTVTAISCASRSNLSITVDQSQIAMGQSVTVEAFYSPSTGSSVSEVVLMPYVNKKRWGSHEFPNSKGKARFILPLPNVETAQIEVIAVPRDTSVWYGVKDYTPYLTGAALPDSVLHSNMIEVNVHSRTMLPRDKHATTFVAQWEPWFAPGQMWHTAQAVPLIGFYEFTNPDVIRQHLLWLMDAGTDAVLFDWSNHIWGCKNWDDRSDGVNQIIHNTEIALEVMADLRDEGLPVPQAFFLLGLSNGPPGTMQALNEELSWIYHYMIRNPRFKDLWFEYDGKPLALILDTGAVGVKEGTTESAFRVPFFRQTLGGDTSHIDAVRQNNPPVNDSKFTIRWTSSQNQVTEHDKLGYWSWMDGSLKPIVTYKDSTAESATVNVACFAENGWTAPEAWGRRNGWTLIESFKTVLEHRPRVVMLHQFNEFTGQDKTGYGPDKNIFVDSYSVELSDDYEPVSLTAPGFRGDKGGWGFYYLNLIKALTDLYHEEANDVTIMAVAPVQVNEDKISIHWTTVGIQPESFTIKLDNEVIDPAATGTGTSLPAAGLHSGIHRIEVIANGVSTRYALSSYHLDPPSSTPIPVVVEKVFNIK